MNKQIKAEAPKTKTTKSKSKLSFGEWFALAIAVLFLVAGTLRAIMLEARNEMFVYVLGVGFVYFAVNTVWTTVKKLR